MHYLRDVVGLTGTNVGCDTSSCGACTVLVDGESVKSCTVLAVQADGADITTIEGLAVDGELHPMQQAFHEHHGLQCGFCTPGMVMATVSLLEEHPAPTERRGAPRPRGQPLSVHRIPQHREGGPRRGEREPSGSCAMTAVVGTRQLRKEDPPLLTGEARFVDDLDVPGALHLELVRSPYAHARIRRSTRARPRRDAGRRRGVHRRRPADEWASPMPCAWPVTDDMKNPQHRPIAVDKVCYVGDAVAVVVADSAHEARDAAEAIIVDYDALPRSSTSRTPPPTRIVVHDELGTNESYTWALIPDPAAVDAAFANAAHTVYERYLQQRLIPPAMEPRGVCVLPQPFGGRLHRLLVHPDPAHPQGHARHHVRPPRAQAPRHRAGGRRRLRVEAQRVRRGGPRARAGPPAGAARRWTEDRSENTQATSRARPDPGHRARGRRQRARSPQCACTCSPTWARTSSSSRRASRCSARSCTTACTTSPRTRSRARACSRTKTPTDAYRGAGRPEATYAIERAMDALAAKIGVDPAEIRRRNFIGTDQFPYTSPAGLVFDCGNYEAALDRALELAGYDALRQEQRERRARGTDEASRHRPLVVRRDVRARAEPRARVAQLLGRRLGVRNRPRAPDRQGAGGHRHCPARPGSRDVLVDDRRRPARHQLDDVDVLHSDTAISPNGLDTYGSRSLAVGGTAVFLATEQVLEKARAIAAHQLEAAEADLEFVDGEFRVRGTPARAHGARPLAFEAFTAHDLPDGMEPDLERRSTWDPPNFTFPFGTHYAWSRSTRRPARSSSCATSRSTTAATRSTRSSSRARCTAASCRASRRRSSRRPSTTPTATS